MAGDEPLTRDQLLHEIAILRDTPGGNEMCVQDPAGVLQIFVEQAREVAGLPPWVPPREASPVTKAVIAEKLREHTAGPTGDYPQGKLDDDDEGALRVTVRLYNGVVRIDFGKNIKWMALPKQDALSFAGVLVSRAFELPDSTPKEDEHKT